MTTDAPETALLLLNYDDLANTRRFLESVRNSSVIDCVVCVDNASPGDDATILAEEFDGDTIAVVSSADNVGYARGNNLAWREAMRRWPSISTIIVSNPDIEIDEQGLQELVNALRPGGAFSAASPVITDLAGAPSKTFAWPQPTFLDVLCSTTILISLVRYRLGVGYYRPPSGFSPIPVDVLSGACFAIREEAFAAVGGFDDRTFLFCEENMLAAKLRRIGANSAVIPTSLARHQVSSSVMRSLGGPRKFVEMTRSYQIYLTEYLNISQPQVTVFRIAAAVGYWEKLLIERVAGYNARNG